MTKVKYLSDVANMARLKIGGIRVIQDPETGVLYYDVCDECEMLLDENEMGYGHECQQCYGIVRELPFEYAKGWGKDSGLLQEMQAGIGTG